MTAPTNVVKFDHEGREITIVGTAHVSQRSIEEVEHIIHELLPDTVCVELDQSRYEALVEDSRWKKLDVLSIIRDNRVHFSMASLALSAYQKKMGERLGVRPGAEMLAAVHAARAVGARLVLADRDIVATLKRTWKRLPTLDRLRLTIALFVMPFSIEEISAEKVEELKNREAMTEMLEGLAQAMPGVKGPLIDERDRYLMSMVRDAPGTRIVAVVGAGHLPGMLAHRNLAVDREELCRIPAPSLTSRLLEWLLGFSVLVAIGYGVTRSNLDPLALIRAWVIPCAAFSALCALAARAKLPTLLTAAVLSPLVLLIPIASAGKLAGLVEARLRTPAPSDYQRAIDDMTSLRGIFGNRFTHVLLVAMAIGFGARLGAAVGAIWLLVLLT